MKKSELQKRIENAEKELAEAKALLAQVETKSRVVNSVLNIPNRDWCISVYGEVIKFSPNNFVQMSTKERAEAVRALIQLIEIHAAIEQEVNVYSCYYGIPSDSDRNRYIRFWFESKELRDEFESKHEDLIETVRKGL